MCQVGVPNGGRCSFIAIGLSNDGKRVFNKACTMPWCHAVVHLEVTISLFCRFSRQLSLPWKHISKASSLSSTVISNARYTRLGPSSVLV